MTSVEQNLAFRITTYTKQTPEFSEQGANGRM